jgi:hypothetical protein
VATQAIGHGAVQPADRHIEQVGLAGRRLQEDRTARHRQARLVAWPPGHGRLQRPRRTPTVPVAGHLVLSTL